MAAAGYTGVDLGVGEDDWLAGSVDDDGFRGVLKGDLNGWESLDEEMLRRRRLDDGDGDIGAMLPVDT